MIGGDRAVFEQTKPIFELMGKQFYFCGGPGMGLQAKLTQNLILANMMQAFNEGIVLATKGGVDPKTMYDILDNSAAKSGLITGKGPQIFKRDFATRFSTKWMHKDVSMALDAGKSLGVSLPMTAVTQQMFQAAISAGRWRCRFCLDGEDGRKKWLELKLKPNGKVSERSKTLSGAREVLLQGSFYEVSLALVGVASLAYFQY